MEVIKEGNRKYYLIQCTKCGKEMKVREDYIKKHSGVCYSCQRLNNKQAFKHGDYKTRLYKIWVGMKNRRYKTNPKVCDDWQDYPKFKEWALNNGYNDNLTIDRIDNSKGYEPGNCQWITLAENAGKDKIIFSDKECIEIYLKRKKDKISQVKTAERLGVSRNTIYRAEKRAREILKNDKIESKIINRAS